MIGLDYAGLACDEPDDDEIGCLACLDSGWVRAEYTDVRLPCPNCDLGGDA